MFPQLLLHISTSAGALIFAVWGALTAQPQQAVNSLAQSAAITLGVPAESRLQDGETRRFILNLPPGSYAHVIVTQQGVALEAAVFTPAGERLAGGERRNRLHGPRHIHLISEGGGAYRLEVRETERTSGKCAVTLLELRAATERDRRLAAAQAIFSEGWHLSWQQKRASYEAALEK
jgi:hypothetical protein